MPITDPTDIAGCELWLAADNIVGYVNGDPLSSWDDESGQGNDFVDPIVGLYPPTYQTNELNGLPVVRFDSSGVGNSPQGLRGPLFFMTGKTAGEVFVVIKINNDPPVSTARSGLWAIGSGSTTHYPYDADGVVYDSWGTSSRKTTVNPTPSLASQFRIYNVSSASGDWTSRLDGSQIYNTATNTVGWASDVGATYLGSSGGASLDGDVAEIIIYDSVLSSGDRTDVESYLNTKYFGSPPPSGPMLLFQSNIIGGMARLFGGMQ